MGRVRRPEVPDAAFRIDRHGKPQVRYGKRFGHYIDPELYPLDWAACGTPAQAQAHRRRGQEPCEACSRAERQASTERTQKRRQRLT
jgi:hypothetical protein